MKQSSTSWSSTKAMVRVAAFCAPTDILNSHLNCNECTPLEEETCSAAVADEDSRASGGMYGGLPFWRASFTYLHYGVGRYE